MTSRKFHRWFAGIGLTLLLIPAASMAQQAGRQAEPSRDRLAEAYDACGGPPIQNGRWVQPTPERDRCLEEHLGLAKKQPAAEQSKHPEAKGKATGTEEPPATGQGR